MNKLTTIVKEGQRVLTTQQLAEVYETDVKNISNNFNRNNDRFILGKHYFKLEGKELKDFKGIHQNDESLKYVSVLYLWTEKGADRHCKILDTDKAWEQFDNLEDTYFRVKESIPKLSKELQAIFILDGKQQQLEKDVRDIKENSPLFNIECEELQNALRKKGTQILGGKGSRAYKDKSLRTKLYSDMQREVKRQFGLHSYKALKRKQLDAALQIIENYSAPLIIQDDIN
ncbi:ORF6C domain-containing protein, partial [Parabacteroides distasonis]